MSIVFILQLLSLLVVTSAIVSIAPNDPLLSLDGRYMVDAATGVVSFDAPGFRLKLGVAGASYVDIYLSAGGIDRPHIFWIYVDGVLVDNRVIDTTGLSCCNNLQKYNVVEGLDPSKSHEITLVKVTESDYNNPNPTVNYLNFHGFEIDAGSTTNLAPAPTRKIEFIGDSITCGYCNQCPVDNKAAYNVESFALSWPTLSASALNASIHTSAWSGLGMVRNCCGGSTFMPEIFQRTLMTVPKSDWSFETTDWVPDAIVINLGTNDGLNPTTPGEVEESYESTYIDLVRNISSRYARDTSSRKLIKKMPAFFLACGPMTSNYCPYVLNVIDALAKVAPAVSVNFLDQRDAMSNAPVCCGHPSAAADTILADITVDTISSVLKW